MYGFNEKLKKKIYYLENKDLILKKRRIYVENNKEVVKKCKEDSRNKNHKYVRKTISPKTKTELMLRRHRKKALKLNLKHDLTLSQWEHILSYFGSCAFCESDETFVGYIEGKDFCLKNVVPICKSCRSSKKERNLHYWLQFDVLRRRYPDKVQKLMDYMK